MADQRTTPTAGAERPTPAAKAAAAGNGAAEDPREKMLTTQLKMVRYRADALIEVLHAVQDIYGFLDPVQLLRVAKELQLPPSRVLGVATFYHLFTFEPKGEHICTVCTGTACFVKGADELIAAVEREFGVPEGQTREDGVLSLLQARCVGACGLAPVALVDGVVVGKASSEMLLAALDKAGVGPMVDGGAS
ncbi:MAG: NAD(P)H-dependent oxidoreductase subunit E [Trueperaceae bacterium]|nr:MAG: NAD(P)H-dependent oxidoreductase subunit E [Trueperaceae bacterium]